MLQTYIKDVFPCGSEPQNKQPDFLFVYFHMALIHNMSFNYCPQDDGIAIFGRITEKIDIFDHPSTNFHICDDFSIHHKQWLFHSNITDKEGKYCHVFSIAYKLNQILDKNLLMFMI